MASRPRKTCNLLAVAVLRFRRYRAAPTPGRAVAAMTDARFPERWLTDRRLLLLPDDAFRLYVNAMLWSVGNKTDGRLYNEDLPLIPGGYPVEVGADMQPTTSGPVLHLAKSGLWRRVADYWLITEFADTQSSRDELDALAARRRADRDRKAAQRRRSSDAMSADGSRDRPAERVRPGQARQGQDRTSTDEGW